MLRDLWLVRQSKDSIPLTLSEIWKTYLDVPKAGYYLQDVLERYQGVSDLVRGHLWETLKSHTAVERRHFPWVGTGLTRLNGKSKRELKKL